jgi:type II secretory pathway component PulM
VDAAAQLRVADASHDPSAAAARRHRRLLPAVADHRPGRTTRDPKRFFLAYALLLLAGTAVAYLAIWPLDTIDDALGLVSALSFSCSRA